MSKKSVGDGEKKAIGSSASSQGAVAQVFRMYLAAALAIGLNMRFPILQLGAVLGTVFLLVQSSHQLDCSLLLQGSHYAKDQFLKMLLGTKE